MTYQLTTLSGPFSVFFFSRTIGNQMTCQKTLLSHCVSWVHNIQNGIWSCPSGWHSGGFHVLRQSGDMRYVFIFYWERAELIKRRWERRLHYKYVFSQNILGKNACGNWGRRSRVAKSYLGLPRPCAVFVYHQKCTETSVKTVQCLMVKVLSQYDNRWAARVLIRKISVPVRFAYPNFETAPRVKCLLH